jgi:hypothetical protein
MAAALHRLARTALVVCVCWIVLDGSVARSAAVDWRPDTPYALHSMAYATSPYGFKRAMFSEAAAAGGSSIRLDIPIGAIFADGRTRPDWATVDEVVALSREFRIRVTAVVLDTPWWLAKCPPDTPWDRVGTCAPADARAYADMVGELVAHTRGTIDTFEVLNEPDGPWAYSGTPEDYAETLALSYDAIKRANPRARVLMGGVMGTYSIPWLERLFAVRRFDAAGKFDVANVHVRGTLAGVNGEVKRWRRFFAGHGIRRPLWVTEHGYPSDPAFQRDPAHLDGEPGQARYLAASTRLMIDAGVAKVFVTQRDNLTGEFASEGILGGTVMDPPVEQPEVRRKPAFFAFRRLARRAAGPIRARGT